MPRVDRTTYPPQAAAAPQGRPNPAERQFATAAAAARPARMPAAPPADRPAGAIAREMAGLATAMTAVGGVVGGVAGTISHFTNNTPLKSIGYFAAGGGGVGLAVWAAGAASYCAGERQKPVPAADTAV